jgi:hypothetical protein
LLLSQPAFYQPALADPFSSIQRKVSASGQRDGSTPSLRRRAAEPTKWERFVEIDGGRIRALRSVRWRRNSGADVNNRRIGASFQQGGVGMRHPSHIRKIAHDPGRHERKVRRRASECLNHLRHEETLCVPDAGVVEGPHDEDG